jgi:hypothetical protein
VVMVGGYIVGLAAFPTFMCHAWPVPQVPNVVNKFYKIINISKNLECTKHFFISNNT